MRKKIIAWAIIIVCFMGLVIVKQQAAWAIEPIIDSGDPKYQTGSYELSDITILFIRIAKIILGFTGLLSLLMFVYGGLTLLISGGSSDKVNNGKKIITAAVIGLIIVLTSWMIIQFVLKAMGIKWDGVAPF